MNALADRARHNAVVPALPSRNLTGVIGMLELRQKIEALRDTMIVLACQITFRVVMLMRQLNY